MALTGFTFLLLFSGTAIVYFMLPKHYQWVALLIASAIFYGSFGIAQSIYILLAAGATYAAGRMMGAQNQLLKRVTADKPLIKRHKRFILAGALAFDLGLLIVLKYARLVFPSAESIVAPLGISFYTLTAIGYLIDLYRNKYEPEVNPLRLLLFVGCFLQVTQGPFVRYDQMSRELKEPHSISYDAVKLGTVRILWGFLKKCVIADWLGVYVSEAMNQPARQGTISMLIAIVLYTVQMYADFSGYMDIVCGMGQILRLNVPENFDRPLAAHSVAEFWRRWHITLGAWFKDYVFYPVSVSKPATKLAKAIRSRGKMRLAKLCPAILALCVVWPLTGLWHGATWNFLLWGVMNGAAIIGSMLLEPVFKRLMERLKIDPSSRKWMIFQVARTFLLLAIIRIFARSATVDQALSILGALGNGFTSFGIGMLFPAGFRKMHMAYCAVAIVLSMVMLLVESKGNVPVLLERFDKSPLALKYAIGVALLYAVLLFSATGEAMNPTFLYATF